MLSAPAEYRHLRVSAPRPLWPSDKGASTVGAIGDRPWHPGPVTFPLSNRTLGHLVEAVSSGNTHTTMETLFLKSGAEPWYRGGQNKEAKARSVLMALRDDGSKDAAAAALEIARAMLAQGKAGDFRGPATWWQPLRDAVAADGWEFDELTDDFLPLVPGATMAAETSWIDAELARRGWHVAAGHYRQAVENFAAGNWASANSQLRAFYESVTRTAGGTDTMSGSGQVQAAFDRLSAVGHLLAGEADFGKALWKLLHPGGSHPGLSDEDESRFRLLTLTGYIRFLLTRLP